MVLSLADLDRARLGWVEELVLQEEGWDLAVAEAQRKKGAKRTAPQSEDGQPVYGMPGSRFVPGRGFQ